MEQLIKEGYINVMCNTCGRVNSISLRHFYDGFEGPFFCKYCGEVLEIDLEEE